MALESEIVRVSFSGNGVTLNFSFPYYFLDATDLDVYSVSSLGVETVKAFVTDYDVIGAYNPLTGFNDDFSSGASVNFVVAPAANTTIVVIRNNPDTQDTSFSQNSAFSSLVVETAMDKIVMMVQYLVDRSKRSIRMSEANTQTFDNTLPNPLVADSTLAVNPSGTGWVMGPTASYITAAITAAAASAAAAAASAAAALVSQVAALASQVAAAASAVAASNSATAILGFVGSGYIIETSFTLANNQVAAADVTGCLFNPSIVRSFELDAQFYINTTGAGATEMSAREKYLGTYKTVSGTWDLAPMGSGGDFENVSNEPCGITLSITNAGQVQYTSTNVSGTPATSVMHFRASTMGV